MPSREPADNHDPLVDLGKATIGSAVRARRRELGWPQRWLAFQASVSQPVISRLESGKLNGIRWQTLARIVGVLAAGRGLELPGLADWQLPASTAKEISSAVPPCGPSFMQATCIVDPGPGGAACAPGARVIAWAGLLC